MQLANRPLAVLLAVVFTSSIALSQPAPAPLPTPIKLKPISTTPITLHMVDESKTIYQAIGKVAGLTVLFDQDYQSRHSVQLDLTDATLAESLRVVGLVTGTFYLPLTSNTIYVAADTRAKHVDLDELDDYTFYLKNSSGQADANEIVTALRNMLPAEAKVYLVSSQDAIAMRSTPENIARAQKLLTDLDLPKKTYRLTYTVTDMDGSKLVSTEHFSVVTVSSMQCVFKQGSKVPIATGSYNTVADDKKAAGAQTQFTYLDVGMNFDSTLTGMGTTAMLRASVEQSSVAPTQSGVGPQDPIILNTSLHGVFLLPNGKTVKIGTLDLPGTTHHLDVEAVAEPLL